MSRSRAAILAALMSILTAGVAGRSHAQTATAGQLVISEFRYRGPNGANDEFIEVRNVTNSDHTVTSLSGSGYGVAASDGFTRCSLPNGTIIPAGGTYLCVNSIGYSLAAYPAGNGTTATGNATYTTNIPENVGLALFNNNVGGGSYTLANRLDAVGTTAEANTLYKEGTGLPTIVGFSINYSWLRDQCGKGGSITTFGPCPTIGATKDTNNNAADFVFVDTNGTSAGGGQRLGAPGPQNDSSPIFNDAPVDHEVLDTCVGATSPPNFVRDLTSNPPQNSTFGQIDVRYTFTNNTGVPLTRLRFRIVDLTTFPAPSGIADLRPLTSTPIITTVDRPPCGSTSNIGVDGTTLEQPPSQPNGGGFNSTMSVPSVTLLTPLANGASVDVRFLFGVQQVGAFKFGLLPEALPEGGAEIVYFQGCTDGTCPEFDPFVTSIQRANPNPTSAGLVDFTVSFSEPVTGVDASDFAVAITGSIAGPSISNVAGSGDTWTVTVDTGTGTGTIRLDLADDDTIIDADTRPLGGPGAGNGDYDTGQVYTIIDAALVPPTVVAIDRADPTPTAAASVSWTVRFNEPVTGVNASDFVLVATGTVSGAAITGVTGSGDTYTVTASTGTGDGTLGLNLQDDDSILDADSNPLAGPGDNGDFVGQAYTIAKPPVVVSIVPNPPNPTTLATATFTVTFSENVTGVDATDFVLTTTIPGAAIVGVAGSGAVYTVTVNTGFPTIGTIRLDVVDNDSIGDSDANPLGGFGAGNGNFTNGGILQVGIAPSIPALDPRMLVLLAVALAAVAVMLMRG